MQYYFEHMQDTSASLQILAAKAEATCNRMDALEQGLAGLANRIEHIHHLMTEGGSSRMTKRRKKASSNSKFFFCVSSSVSFVSYRTIRKL